MGRKTKAIEELSGNATGTLTRLGDNIAVAIKSRETMVSFAERIGVNRDTLRKLTNGDPSTQIGVLVATLDALGIVDHLNLVADPANDTLGQSLRLGRASSVKHQIDSDF